MINADIINKRLAEQVEANKLEGLRRTALRAGICPCCGGELRPVTYKVRTGRFLWWSCNITDQHHEIYTCKSCENVEEMITEPCYDID